MDVGGTASSLRDDSFAARVVSGIIDGHPDPSLLLDPAGIIVRANAHAAGILGGVPPEDLVGRNLFDILPHSVADSRRAWLQQVVATGATVRAEDQSPSFSWESTLIPVKDATGAVVLVAVLSHDSTDRTRAESALRSSQEHYRALFDHMAEGIGLHRVVRDSTGTIVDYQIVDINPACEAILGVRRDEVVGRAASEVYGSAPPPLIAEYSTAMLTGKPLRFQSFYAPLRKYFAISAVPLGSEEFATIFFDVSALKASQQEQEKLIALVENSNEFIGLAALDGRVLYVNEAARRMAGLDPDQPVDGLSISDFMPSETRSLVARTVMDTVREHGHWAAEAVLAHMKTGIIVPVDVSVFTIPSRETGEPMCLATVMHDATERMRTRKEREHLELQLRQSQKMEAIGRLAGGVAHDFNNQLTSILGNVSMVLDDLDPNDASHAMLSDVRQAAESAAALTRQLLAFSRKQLIAPKVLSLDGLIANMERMLRRIIGEDVLLETKTTPGLGNVRVDPAQVEQILVNVAVNARDAMPEGGHLLLEADETDVDEDDCQRRPDAKPGRYVRLVVSDTGIGMSDEVKARAFEPFFTTKGKGTGLGLSTVYGAVTQNGGFVDLYSEVGRGTTIKIYLPVVKAAVEAQAVETPRPTPGGKETILLVEDEDVVRELAERMLIRLGYTVFSHPTGMSALAAAERYRGTIHLLVTDVVMPGMNGRELALRLVEQRPGIKVLYSSGYTNDIIVRHGLVEEGLAFISKPYTTRMLGEMIRSVLDG
jgi:two-component system, cell cycle sensor histidine kinase and response regulator CckA